MTEKDFSGDKPDMNGKKEKERGRTMERYRLEEKVRRKHVKLVNLEV